MFKASTFCQFYYGGQFYCWKKSEFQEGLYLNENNIDCDICVFRGPP
jgi:hypothetical protein